MNERIDNLAMIANDQTGNKFDLNHKELDVFLKKYAELLVEECARVAFLGSALPLEDSEQIRDMIIGHFGIEQ